jgi:hypothetical protein
MQTSSDERVMCLGCLDLRIGHLAHLKLAKSFGGHLTDECMPVVGSQGYAQRYFGIDAEAVVQATNRVSRGRQ